MSSSIPQPPGLPFLGNVLDINPNDTWGSLKKLADKYGPIFKINALGKQIVIVGSAALAEEVCDEKRFRKNTHAPFIFELRKTVHDALISAHDDEPNWGISHRIMAPFVSPSYDEARVTDIQDVISDLTKKWTSNPAQRINLTVDLQLWDMQAVIYALFGQRYNLMDPQGPPVVEVMIQISWEILKRSSRPRLVNWLYYDRVYAEYIREFRKIGADLIAAKKAEQTPKQDLLYGLLFNKDPQTGESLDEEKIIDAMLTLMLGAVTNTGLMSSALYYLLTNPEKMSKAREEIDRVVGPKPRIAVDDLSRLPYLEAILNETVRLSAPAPGFVVEPIPSDSPANIQLADGKYEIPSKQSVMLILQAINRDPEVFTDPEAFQPERMLGEGYEKLPPGARKGWGNGKRRCFAPRFAWHLSMITLIHVLRSVHLQMADENYELRYAGKDLCSSFQAPVDLFVTVGPRKSSEDDK
ncbi:NADPH cytochrome P450 [Talaromyces proteolyticus]|uniref:NADPH cytochrome P450 n=1 Tax=Talaromyces proteolyticus TaxID=1131652 RepID=A0AAD4PWA1_9EURO|nr:NADPH cytochrome P450 [Talaromyces proteolyticus]KAH8692233.1 NADPH cytochrome P450 [Talaromyces proteolyticus]